MKRIICAFLVAVLCMNLYVPALAVEEVPDYEVGTFYWDDSDGNTYTTVKSVEPDGTYKVTVSGISGTTEAVRKGDIVDFTSITPEGEVHQWSVDLSPSETESSYEGDDNMISPMAIQTISGEEWGFSCKANDANESTRGITWTLFSEEGGHVGQDKNNSEYRGYAENFWDCIISMNAAIRSAKAKMLSADLSTTKALVSALAGALGTLDAVHAAMDIVQCQYEGDNEWKTAREYANKANYYFLRFRKATQSTEQRLLEAN